MNRSNSSFYWVMRLLPKERRDAMFAVYDYCRLLDDIADGPLPLPEKAAKLSVLRGAVAAWIETGIPLHPALDKLAPAAKRYNLPLAELSVLIDGMERDVSTPLVAPERPALEAYCRQVAGSVGLLCIHILDRPDAAEYALLTGYALQLTNILRDVAEDAELGRLYLPTECLSEAGIITQTPRAALGHPALGKACECLARDAERAFERADAELRKIGGRNLKPAAAMAATYRAQLAVMTQSQNWGKPMKRIGKIRKLFIALRVFLSAA